MGYSHQSLIRTILITTVLFSLPKLALSHVGHGDEFQATGGIERVEVNPEIDQMLGIVVTPIAPATDGSASILVPITALVNADNQQLVFVQYQNFYEPVPITTGATQAELIEVMDGLSVGENLVTQGSLSLYAESRKTQTPDTAATPEPVVTQSTPLIDDPAPQPLEMAQQPLATTPAESGFPMGWLVGIAIAVVLLATPIALISTRKKKNVFSDDKGDS
ncbi:cobalt transporter [Phormidium pseudopriestleyi FRX01]|uniref:Cobalt transporter n=1 Tax=Phormidium pseudopriestleyi FRX01 TaxID=1759528 RepID=A0ABS3FWW1_9CYAN|nr:cobalt transporter [Phormidium pseudopriestleyi]MBO0351591.1 cobalt transporter [Phormidium pseudopriestleyi FRX01]